ncbi:histidine kinase [Modestobacter sp. VKM Ac-2983]|uniref:sensor histidine kinase n=1 Tax=Modestobacter sp. VKM Ac-2983 TaxID=3004137 RepID=UPI0022AB639F|nr:histidine kinase [Modestobacter sp. VKM Ac-2983]MCZ2807135.1 histidine kinase [Modestobacter sp. VKM Ac-2983]
MGVRERIWPGLTARGIALEAGLAGLGVVMIVSGFGTLAPPSLDLGAVAVATALMALGLFLFRRTQPAVPFAVCAVSAALGFSPTGPWLLASYAVGRYSDSWWVRGGVGMGGAVAIAVAADPVTFGGWTVVAAATGAIVALPAALGIWQRTREQLLGVLRERAERAEAERELLARDAVLSERTRIAREMHDAVGHRVSLMVLQAGAIELAARDADRVEQLAGQVQTAGRRALVELRQMVGVLRAGDVDDQAPLGPQPGLEDLPRLVDQAREAGMDVALTGAADGPVDSAVGRAAYRIAQEALTNAGKHAPGARVHVTAERRPEELHLRVVNGAPTRPPQPVPGDGYGLVGLGERVRTLGGRLTAEPRLDGGFVVEAVLPA